MPRPRADRLARRSELASAAARVFAERGVANTAVSDIVREAGVAQGTFYLYFDSKDDVVLAVVERAADDMFASIEASVATSGTAVDKLLSLRDVLSSADVEPGLTQVSDFVHHPENRALHDRFAEKLMPRLASLVEAIVNQGIAENSFHVPDARAAAWFVLGGLQSIELSGTSATEMPAAISTVTELALRALGNASR